VYLEDISDAGDTDIHPIASSMGLIDLFPGRRAQRLHAIIRCAQQNGAQSIDEDVQPGSPVVHSITIAIDCGPYTPNHFEFCDGIYGQAQVQHEDCASHPGGHRDSEPPSLEPASSFSVALCGGRMGDDSDGSIAVLWDRRVAGSTSV
jgi:hypothetical protein